MNKIFTTYQDLIDFCDSLLIQAKGTFNHYKPAIHKGTQPIRVLHDITAFMFMNANKNFSDQLIEQIDKGNLSATIHLEMGEDSLAIGNGRYRTPHIVNASKEIQLHETFLSYQWCITYAIYVLFLETIDYPKMNAIEGHEKYKVSQAQIDKANEMFDYARSLITYYSEWDKATMPNPEKYPATNRNYVEQTNIFYSEGVKFILAHEFVHAMRHLPNPEHHNPDNNPSYFLEIEKEADKEAIDIILQGKDDINKWAIEVGSVFGILSMFFFRADTTGVKHPNMEDRLTDALLKLQVADNEYAWAIACVGLKLWDKQFELFLNWNQFPTYRDLYFDVVRQIKENNA